jgi:outer membrane protein OmpA-like peptidoglycan-associated protein
MKNPAQFRWKSIQRETIAVQYGESDEQNDGEMGPGIDLVMSILAFVVMLLAILANEDRIQLAELRSALPAASVAPSTAAHLEADVIEVAARADLERQLDTIKSDLDSSQELASKLSHRNTELEEKTGALIVAELIQKNRIAELEVLLKNDDQEERLRAALSEQLATKEEELNEALSALTLAESETEQLLADATEKLARLEEENQSLNKEISDNEAEIAAAENLLNVQKNRIAITLNDEQELKIFEVGKSELTTLGRRKLYSLLPHLKHEVITKRSNVLRIAGYASPEYSSGGSDLGDLDRNLALSSERALTIAHELARLGISLRCIAIEAYGRSRSEIAKAMLRPNQDLEAFDEHYRPLSNAEKQRLEASFDKERRVEILTTYEEGGQCAPNWLALQVGRASAVAESQLSELP